MMIAIIIVFIALIALAALVAQFDRHGRDRIDLETARSKLAAAQGGCEIDCGASPESLIGNFVIDVGNQMPVTAAVSAAEKRDDAKLWTAIGNIVISLLLVAGLAGTLVSFGKALGGRPEIQNIGGGIDEVAVKQYTDRVHAGLSGAFWPSLAGIVATLVLYFFRGVFVHPRRDRLFADLECFGFELSHKLFPPELKENGPLLIIASKLEAVCGSLETQAKYLLAAGERTKDASTSMGHSATLIEEGVTGLTAASKTITETFSANGAATKGLGAVREVFTKFAKAVRDERRERKASDVSWKSALELLSSEQQKLTKELNEIFLRIADTQKILTDENGKVIADIKIIADGLGKTVTSIKTDMVEAHKTALSELAKRLNATQDAHASRLNQTVAGIKTSADKLESSLNDIEPKLKAAFGEALIGFHHAVNDTVKTVGDSVIRVPAHIAEAEQSLGKTMAQAQREALQAHEAMLQRIEEAVATCVEATTTVAKQAERLVAALAATVTGAAASPSESKLAHRIDELLDTNLQISGLLEHVAHALQQTTHAGPAATSKLDNLWLRLKGIFYRHKS